MKDYHSNEPCGCHADARPASRPFLCTRHLLEEFEREIFERVKTAQQMDLLAWYSTLRRVWRAAQRALKEIGVK